MGVSVIVNLYNIYMCGIIGIFGKNDPSGRARQSLERIVHRGSNVFELEDFENGSLGANRLPIVDRQSGRQPKHNETKTIFAVQNGEIFNHVDLRNRLQSKGHTFETSSDTEVLAHLYEEYGAGMVDVIDSEMFAFVVYDIEKDIIFAARDPLGVKPLYYAFDRTGQIYFASELKQLSMFDDIEIVHDFPPGSYYLNGEFHRYFTLEITNVLTDEHAVIERLERQLVEAVAKRVDTDLPIGVFLSGGVDSSLIMEIASRFHADVTAIILGRPGSPDYEFALRLCKERKYKYHVIYPEVDYEKELENIVYHLETYEPLIIRQSFAIDVCARESARLGIRVVLVGEGSDELFGGYNEFSGLPDNLVNTGCKMLTESLNAGHLSRVDRMSMRHTIEVRAPFFDGAIVETAMNTAGSLKVRRVDHQVTTKYIIRKLAERFIPGYIAWRYKVPFSNGAGMNVGNNYKAEDGDVAKIVLRKPEIVLSKDIVSRYGVSTREERYYLGLFDSFGFSKLAGSEKRLVVKDTLVELYQSEKTRMLVAEFDRLALYFPVYFAAQRGVFDLHGLEVDFISTGGDDKTYDSLVNNSAQIGLSDPMFAMFENTDGVKGEIIAEVVQASPNVAVAIRPNILLNSLEDFRKYRVGTFQQYSTTHTLVRAILPEDTQIITFEHGRVLDALVNRSIDVAIVLREQALDIEVLGGKILYEFSKDLPRYLFSGFTIASILQKKYRDHLTSFVVAVRESIRYIRKNREESRIAFSKMFPTLKQPDKTFDQYVELWSTTLRVEKEDYRNAHHIWKSKYPALLKTYQSYFPRTSTADPIMNKMNARMFRRDYPFLEDRLRENIGGVLQSGRPLRLFGFWGASEKGSVDVHDKKTINYFREYISSFSSFFEGGVEVTWILSDEHAEGNGYSRQVYREYLGEIEKLLIKSGFRTIYLSALWSKWKMDQAMVEQKWEEKPKGWWEEIGARKKLERQAGTKDAILDPVSGAQRYYILRSLEKSFLEQEFPDSVFFAYSDGSMQPIYPTLPTLYLYTSCHGDGVSPWFFK